MLVMIMVACVFLACFVFEPDGQLLLIDSRGRATGYDPVTKTVVQEIPDSGYIQDPRTLFDEPLKQLRAGFHAPGIYTLHVIGVRHEKGCLSLSILDAQLNHTIVDEYFHLTSRTVRRYQITFRGIGIPAEVTHVTAADLRSLKRTVRRAFRGGKIDQPGLLRSLFRKLDAAEAALNGNRCAVAKDLLGAFIYDVQAQKGTHIRTKVARGLIRDARQFLAQVQ